MKKIKVFLITAFMGLMLLGCGSGQNKASDADSGTAVGAESVKTGNLVISLNDDMEDIKEELGEPVNYTENKSCLYDGYDKTYTYTDVEIITYPMNGKEYISSINILTDDAVSGSGIRIGSSAETVAEKYGEENLAMSDTYYIYETDGYGYSFYLEDGTVAAIEAYLLTE